MKLREIIELAAILLQLDDVLAHPSIKDGAEYALDQFDPVSVRINQLIRCADLVIKQTAAEYIPLEIEEEIVANGKTVGYDALKKPIVDLLGVKKSDSGCKVSYKVMPNSIVLGDSGRMIFRYTYEPKKCGLDDEIDYPKARVPARVFAYGTAAEWALISAMYEEASIWDRRFKTSLLTLYNSNAPKRVRARKWF